MSPPRLVSGDVELLRQAVRGMTRKQALYRMLKTELTAQGHWQNRPRGNPKAGYQAAKGMHEPFKRI